MTLKNRKGAATVELALVLPLMLLVVFGITEFGRAFWITNTLTNAAREAARRASISPVPIDQPTAEGYVRACLQGIQYDPTELTVVMLPNDHVPVHGADTITIAVELPFRSTVPIIDLSSFNLHGEASMLYE